MQVISSNFAAKNLKAKIGGGQGKIYIRPIQKSLSVKPIVKETHSSLKDKCMHCGEEMLLKDLRKHVNFCGIEQRDIIDDCFSDNDLIFDIPPFSGPLQEELAEILGSNINQNFSTEQQSRGNGFIVHNGPENVAGHSNDSEEDAEGEVENSIVQIYPKLDDIESKVKGVVKQVRENSLEQNPVEILRSLQNALVSGRRLEINDLTADNSGKTNFILVDRNNILDTGFDEIEALDDKFITLEVQFYNEVQ